MGMREFWRWLECRQHHSRLSQLTRIMNNVTGHLELFHWDLAVLREEENIPIFVPHIE